MLKIDGKLIASELRGELKKEVSSFPNGLPCAAAEPDLLGDPYPIVVLQDIVVGFLAF